MRRLLPNHASGPAPDYYIGNDAPQACGDLLLRRPRLSCDIETMGLGAASYQIKAVIVSNGLNTVVLDGQNERHRKVTAEVLDSAAQIVFHNSPFDVPPLVSAGWMTLDMIEKALDTLIWARMAYPSRMGRGLEQLEPRLLSGQFHNAVKDRLTYAGKVAGHRSKGETFAKLQYDDPVYGLYAAWDALVTHRIVDPVYNAAYQQQVNHDFDAYGANHEDALWLLEREQIVNRLTLHRSAKGFRIDDALIRRQVEEIRRNQIAIEAELASYGVLDPQNRNQLIDALHKADAFPGNHPRTGGGAMATDKKSMEKFTHPIYLAFRKFDQTHRIDNYLSEALKTALETDGRCHPQVNIGGADTGRMSYSNPPFHQYQGESRHAILADDDSYRVVSTDWTAIEPVMAASLSYDRKVLDLYDSETDLYEGPAAEAGIQRKPAKIMVLADLYGQGIARLAGAHFNDDTEEAIRVKNVLRANMPNTASFIEYSRRWSELTGKTWTVSGRIIKVDSAASYKGTNFTVQGSAYDQLAETCVLMYRAGMKDHFLIAMHDELVTHDVVAEEIKCMMETPLPRLVQLSGRSNRLRTDQAIMGPYWADPDLYAKIQNGAAA